MKSIALIASWHFMKKDNKYYCPSMHYVYVRFVVTMYDKVYLIAPVEYVNEIPHDRTLTSFDNFEVIEIPNYSGYLEGVKYKKYYKTAIVELEKKVDVFYCRVPGPFSWMPALYTSKSVIMHFVGDILDVTRNNIHFSWLKKKIYILGYYPELRRVNKAASKSIVYANGLHIAKKLIKEGIKATPVISSTLSEADFTKTLTPLQNSPFRLIYIGYLRYAKGIDTLMKVIIELKRRNFPFSFDIVGDGEMSQSLKDFVKTEKLEKQVKLHGYIDDRDQMYKLLGQNDLFFFPSLSEGSPRVVIEAMGQGLPVLSTPVGSLPRCFIEKEEILFFPFNDIKVAVEKIIYYSTKLDYLDKMRKNSYSKAKKEFTIEKFLGQVMHVE